MVEHDRSDRVEEANESFDEQCTSHKFEDLNKADPVTVSDGEVLSDIPEYNPFREAVADLRNGGADWGDIQQLLEEAYDQVDKAAYEESFTKLPVYELKIVVHDEKATSGERYETVSVTKPSEADAREWAELYRGAHRVEHIEQIDTQLIG